MAKKNGKAKRKQREAMAVELELLPFPDGDFGPAEAEEWLGDPMRQYMRLTQHDVSGLIGIDIEQMVGACFHVTQGGTVRFTRGEFYGSSREMAHEVLRVVASSLEHSEAEVTADALEALVRCVVAMLSAEDRKRHVARYAESRAAQEGTA